MKKRILAWALLVCMLATLLPASAYAEGELAEEAEMPVGEELAPPADGEEATDPVILSESEESQEDPAEPVGADAPDSPEDLDEPTDPVILDESEESQDEPVGADAPGGPLYAETDDSFVDPFLDVEAEALQVADEPQEIVDSGSCGDNLTWTLDDGGTLTISGEGAMADVVMHAPEGNSPWGYASRIIHVRVLDGVTSIGANAFIGAQNLTDVQLGESVSVIGASAFSECSGLRTINLPDSLTTIGPWAFSACSVMEGLELPEALTSIGDHAFSNCRSITSANFSDSLNSIGSSAFSDCYALADIYYSGTLAQRADHFADGSWNEDSFRQSPDLVWHCADGNYPDNHSSAASFDELKELAARDYSGEWTTVSLRGSGNLVVEEDLTLPDGMGLNFYGINLIVPEGVTLRVEGSLSGSSMQIDGSVYLGNNRIGQGDFVNQVTVNGQLTLNMWLWVDTISGRENIRYEDNGKVAFRAYPEDEAALYDALALAEKADEHTVYNIYVQNCITLSRDLTLPKNGYSEKIRNLNFGGGIIVPEGITLCTNGSVYVSNCLEVAGTLENNGYLLCSLHAYTEEELRGLLGTKLNAAGSGTTEYRINLFSDVTLQEALYIAPNQRVDLCGEHSFVVPAGITMTVDGTLIQHAGELRLDGTLTVNGHAELYPIGTLPHLSISESGVLGGTGELVISGQSGQTPETAMSGYRGPAGLKNRSSWIYYFADGLHYADGKRYYLKNGKYQTGWQQIDGKWYIFASDGAARTGWVKSGSKWYYMNASGIMQTGWVKVGSTWYYFKSSGAMVTGWQKIGGTWYYFKSSGAMVTGWQKIGGTWYYFKSSGAMKTGWVKSGGKWYYMDSSGAMLANTSRNIGGKVYYFNASGVCQNP